MEIPNEPDDKKVFDLLRNVGMSEDGAYIAVQEIRTMAGQNIIAKLDAQEARLGARVSTLKEKLDAQASAQASEIQGLRAQLDSLKWFITAVIVTVGLVVSLIQALNASREAARIVQGSGAAPASVEAPSPNTGPDPDPAAP